MKAGMFNRSKAGCHSLETVIHMPCCLYLNAGPCGTLNRTAPCCKDGTCIKGIPKAFAAVTTDSSDGYPEYRLVCSAYGHAAHKSRH